MNSESHNLRGLKMAIWLDRPPHQSKFAFGALRFARDLLDIRALVFEGGEQVVREHDAFGVARGVPVVKTLDEALPLGIDTVTIGVSPIDVNERFSPGMLEVIRKAARLGLRVVNPTHVTDEDDPEVRRMGLPPGTFTNLRSYPRRLLFADRALSSKRVLCAGNECSNGKMTTAVLITERLRSLGVRASFLATGQTGIMVAGGRGVAVDHVRGDFITGAVEAELLECEKEADVVVIEGQASLLHPAYSPMAAAIFHASSPQAIVLSDDPNRKHLKFYERRPVPTLSDEWEAIRALSRPGTPPTLVGIARIGGGAVEGDPAVPVCDPLAEGVAPIVERLRNLFEL